MKIKKAATALAGLMVASAARAQTARPPVSSDIFYEAPSIGPIPGSEGLDGTAAAPRPDPDLESSSFALQTLESLVQSEADPERRALLAEVFRVVASQSKPALRRLVLSKMLDGQAGEPIRSDPRMRLLVQGAVASLREEGKVERAEPPALGSELPERIRRRAAFLAPVFEEDPLDRTQVNLGAIELSLAGDGLSSPEKEKLALHVIDLTLRPGIGDGPAKREAAEAATRLFTAHGWAETPHGRAVYPVLIEALKGMNASALLHELAGAQRRSAAPSGKPTSAPKGARGEPAAPPSGPSQPSGPGGPSGPRPPKTRAVLAVAASAVLAVFGLAAAGLEVAFRLGAWGYPEFGYALAVLLVILGLRLISDAVGLALQKR